jgi:hypothetical protein
MIISISRVFVAAFVVCCEARASFSDACIRNAHDVGRTGSLPNELASSLTFVAVLIRLDRLLSTI